MECVRVRFAPGTEAVAAKSILQRAVRSVNRQGLWPTLYPDFFAFAEIPVEETELPDAVTAPELPETASETDAAELSETISETDTPELSETMNAAEPPDGAELTSLAVPESPFFCILLCPSISPELLRELAARAGDIPGGMEIRMSFSPLTWEEAEDFYREALDTCREQLPVFPHGVAPELASACEHLALLLSDTSRATEAEALFREALTLYRELSDKAAVADACGNLARTLHAAGRLQDAEKLYCEAMDIYRELSKRNADYQAPLARICQDLAMCLEDCRRPEAAEWFYRTSLDLYRKLAERNAEAYAPCVASTCGNLAGLLKAAGRVAEAAGLYRIALDTYTKLVQENPAKWEPELGFLYENLAAFEFARSPASGKALLQSAWMLYQKYPNLSAEAERVQAQLREL